MRARTAFASVIFAFCSAFTTTFDGCGGGGPPGGPLPPSDEPTCITDSDCPATGCEDRRCIGGVCTVIADVRDGDGDGEGPPPCGVDCNDFDAMIAPGRPELCDGLDQDCDTMIDEDAPPTAVRRVLGLADERVRAAPFGTGLVLLETALSAGVTAIAADFVGRAGATVVVDGTDPNFYDVARSDEGAVAVVFHAASGLIEGIPLSIDGGGDPSPGARFSIADVSADPRMNALAAHALPFRSASGGTTFVLGVSWTTPFGSFVWLDGLPGPIEVVGSTFDAAPDLATDGTSLVVAEGTNDAVFYDPATGVELGRQAITGRWSRAPIDSDDGRIVSVVADAFDAAIVAFTATTATSARPAPSVSPPMLAARIDTGTEFHVVTRFDDGMTFPTSGFSGVWAAILDPVSLERIGETFSRDVVSGSGTSGLPVTDFDVVVSEHGAAVLSSFGRSGTAITTFACREGG